MITLYIDDKPVGTWAEAERVFAESAGRRAVEFRDERGRVIATSVPGAEPVDWESPREPANLPPLDGPWKTLDEWRRELGWDEDDDGAAGPVPRR